MPSWKVGDIVIERGMGPAYPRQRRIVEVMGDGYYMVHHPAEQPRERFPAHESNLITPTIKEERMPETVNLLETALENEGKLFLKLINELQNEELYDFIRRISVLEPKHVSSGRSATEDILHIAQNARQIEDALGNFYVA